MNKYSKELLTSIVIESISIAEVLRKLGINPTGGSHSHISRKIREYEIDTSHFLGQRANSGKRHKGGLEKRKPEDLLTILSVGTPPIKADRLRKALLFIGREAICEECSVSTTYNEKPLQLEIHHKNTNKLDNRSENLSFLCPNCHSQTPTHSQKNAGVAKRYTRNT